MGFANNVPMKARGVFFLTTTVVLQSQIRWTEYLNLLHGHSDLTPVNWAIENETLAGILLAIRPLSASASPDPLAAAMLNQA